VFAGHAGEVYSIAFDPTGICLLTGSDIVRLWSIADIATRLESERKPDGLELRWALARFSSPSKQAVRGSVKTMGSRSEMS